MKKLLLILCFVLSLCFPAFSIDLTTADSITIAWDPVEDLISGGLIPENTEVKYEVFITTLSDTAKENIEKIIENPILELEYTIKFELEGKFIFGVRSVRIVDGEAVAYSDIAWSDDPLYCRNGETFGAIYFVSLSNPKGFRIL